MNTQKHDAQNDVGKQKAVPAVEISQPPPAAQPTQTVERIPPLKTNDLVLYGGKQYNVKLNGKNVYMRLDGKKFTLGRKRAEALPRVQSPIPVVAVVQAERPTTAAQPVVKPAKASTGSQPTDKMAQLRALLATTMRDGVDVDEVTKKVAAIFISANKLGGVYLIQVTKVAGKPIEFLLNGKVTEDFVMVKIGKADDYKVRFGQFKFGYREVLRVDGDTTMEAALKRTIPANWMRYFFEGGSQKETVLKAIGIPGNNGPTEWRIMRKSTLESIHARRDSINSLNWQKELHLTDPVSVGEKEMTLRIGGDKERTNLIMLQIF